MSRILTLLLLTLLCTSVRAQVISGRVTDAETGEPLPFASIYVEASKSGAASNADGYFRVKMGPGSSRVVFSYLGYQTQVKTLRGGQEVQVEMTSETLNLEQVEIISGGEDKSYSVIRRAIAKADYHLNQLDRYEAKVYIKGTGKVNKVPGLLMKLAPKEDREEMQAMIDRPFTSESTSKIIYERPNTYREEVLSKYEVGDSDFDANGYIFTSFYEPMFAGEIVSPLSPKSFGYYKFEHQGVFVDQDELINRIKVIPRSRGEDVFEGYVNIVHDDWSLHSLELTTYKLGFKIDITQQFAEVEDHIWQPITTTLDAGGKIFGFAFEYHYLSTISEYALTLNPDLDGYVEVIDEKTQPEAAKRAKKANRDVDDIEQKLNEGGELTRKELRKLMREYEKEERKASEEPEVVSKRFYTDSAVQVIDDTAAWAALRPVPLTELEKRGYAISDSIAKLEKEEEIMEVKSEDGEPKIKLSPEQRDSARRVNYQRRIRKLRFQVSPPDPFFNPVAGYVLGTRLGFKRTKGNLRFGIHPSYGFGWEQALAEADFGFGRSGKRGQYSELRWQLKGGRSLQQYNATPAIEPWISTFTNLLNGRNFIRLYERQYVSLQYRRSYSDKFRLEVDLLTEGRSGVSNSANNNWFGLGDDEIYAPNIVDNAQIGRIIGADDATTARIGVSWRPGLRYAVNNKSKRPIDDSAPTVNFALYQGFDGLLDSKADFTRLEASYEHRFNNGRKGDVDVLVRAGSFLNNKSVSFPDFKHFATSEITLTSLDPIGSYRLLPYYQESTSEEYLEVYGHYQFRKLLLTQIWQLHLMGLKEDVFVNYLHTPTSEHYTEVGYSIDNIFRFFRLEFVTSFRDFQYHDFGVRFSVASSLIRGEL